MAVTANVSRKSGRVAAKEASKPKESKQPKLKKTMSVDAKSEKKKKQPAASGSQRSHPPYFQMAVEAIATLRERKGSSRRAIAKYIEAHYKSDLPSNFKKLLTNQLRILSEKGKLVQVKRSFKLTEELKKSSQVKAIKAATKPPAASSGKPVAAKKPKPAEPAQAKKQTVSAKSPKPKAAEKPKAAAVKPKAKAVSEKKSAPPPAPAPAPAPPVSTPKVQKTASVVSVKKEKPSSSKAAKLKPVKTSTPAKSTPAPRKSPRGAPPAAASKKPITSPPPKKKKKTARN